MIWMAAQGVIVRGSQEFLRHTLADLVENALRYTPTGTRTNVGMQCSSEVTARLSVKNDGPGAAGAVLPQLMNRFYR